MFRGVVKIPRKLSATFDNDTISQSLSIKIPKKTIIKSLPRGKTQK
jgi:hypothetical protein